jgi:glycosyltransferase involved in cell wall biosynthesis
MGHDLPIVAFGAAAVPETVGEGGLVLTSKEPIAFAAAVERVVTDRALAQQLVAAGRRNLERYDLASATDAFLATLLGGLDATS